MLTHLEGIYRNGCVELTEQPDNLSEGMRVIVTFMPSKSIDLALHIDRSEAEQLRASLLPFSEDWNSPEMSIYDDYDTAKANL